MKNHRVVVPRRGGSEVLTVVEEEMPEPGPGEVRIATLAAGVSSYDIMLASGYFPGFPRVPYTPGVDVVGVVDKLGPDVEGIEVGSRVAAGPLPAGGGYTEFLCQPADEVVPVPDGLDEAEAVSLVANYITAHLAIQRAEVKSGDQVLIQGAAGGVGTALVQLGRLAGFEMYGTASRYNHQLVTALGAKPIDYHTEDVVARVRELTGDGVDAVFDPIGGSRQIWRSYHALRKGGRLVWFGMAASSKSGLKVIPLTLLTVPVLKLLPDGRKALTTPRKDGAWNRETLRTLLTMLEAGDIKPMIGARVPLLDASKAHQIMERGGHAGKVVLMNEAATT